MPAIPVMQSRVPASPEEFAKQGIFERGDHIYLTTPVQAFRPNADQIEEFAFSNAVKSVAPNENIVWFKGQYVEADNPNGNGAMWEAEELGIKSLTPMLMPVTVMHDPRTAVGTIADVKMLTPEKDGVKRARIDTVLALWGHRFPEAVHEAEANAAAGTLMQSMECYSPWYECSECGKAYHKMPQGAEEANWCEHLKASNPSAGYVGGSDEADPAQSSNASRILGDVCFTGTGLIFGTRGARGAYSEAFLEELAQMHGTQHQAAHTSTASDRSAENMGLVQIEQSELDTLRGERDTARTELAEEKTKREEAERATVAAETAKSEAEAAQKKASDELAAETEKSAKAELKTKRLGELGDGFKAKLGDFTKSRLDEQAESLSDEDWDNKLKELEEVAKVKRDAKKDGEPSETETDEEKVAREAAEAAEGNKDLTPDELAGLLPGSGKGSGGDGGKAPTDRERSSVVGSLAGAFKGSK